MKTETRVCSVESSTGWALKIWRLGLYFRCEIETPEGRVVFSKSLATSLEDDDGIYESVQAFFTVRGIEHTGKTLVEQARAELRMSAQEAS